MLNLDIIFNGRANFSQAESGIKKLRAEYALLGQSIQAAQKSAMTTGNTSGWKKQQKEIAALRKELLTVADASGALFTETKNVTTASRAFNDELGKNKVRFRDIIGNMSTVKQAYKEQIAIQNMWATSWQRSATGKMSVDMMVPRELPKAVDTFRQKLGYANALLRSGSEQMINWGKNTQWAGRQLMVGFTVPTAIAGAAAAKLGYDLDVALTRIVKVYGDVATASTTSSETIRKNALDTAKSVAASYGQSFKDTLEIQAELAATGMTGGGLQTATTEVSRAKMLGDLNTQDALKSTITLMSAYGLKADELGQKFNFMNSMENSTVLTMQDMVEAFPRVSGLMNTLGVSVEQTSVLLAAFKAAGIDAEEGATALKSISFKAIAPTPTSEAAFMGITGKSLKEIVNTTKGELLPTIEAISKSMGDLDRAGKTELIARIFGIHQGSKAFALIDQLSHIEDSTTQIGRAWEVANQGSDQWAATANMELSALQNSLSGRFNRAIETAKGSLAELGTTVLEMILPLVQAGGKLIEFVNSMDEGQKKFLLWTVAAVGAIGPVVMFAGLLGNLIGTAGKVTAMFANLGLRFKVMTEEERAAALVQNNMKNSFDTTAVSAQRLGRVIQLLEAQLERANKAALKNKTVTTEQYAAMEAVIAGEAVKSAKTGESRASIISNKVGATASVAGLGLSMFSDSGAAQTAGNVLFVAGAVAPLLTNMKMLNTIGEKSKTMFGNLANRMTPLADAGKKVGSSWSKLAGTLGMSGGAAAAGVTAVLGGILLLHEQINNEVEETNKKYQSLIGSGNTWANVLGFAPKATPANVEGDGKQKMTQQLDAMKAQAKDLFDILQQHQADGYDIGAKWAVALNEGLKTKLMGGSDQNVQDTIQTAMAAMGETFTKEEFALTIKTKLNFNFAGDQIQAGVDNLKATFKQVVNQANDGKDGWGETLARGLTMETELNSVDAASMKSALDSFWTTYKTLNKQDAREAFDDLGKTVDAALKDMWEKSGKDVDFDTFIKTNHRAQSFLQSVIDSSKEFNNISLNRPISNFAELSNALAGLAPDAKPAEAALRQTGMAAKYAAMDAATGERNMKGVATAVTLAGNAAAAAAFGWQNLDDALAKVNITGDQVVDAMKGAMSHANDLAFQAADDQFNNVVQGRIDAIQAAADRTSANIDRQIDASQTKFDAASKSMSQRQKDQDRALDASQKAQERSLEEMQKNRQKSTEDYWDAQIKAIEDQKDAVAAQLEQEKELDDARQRFFEAEQARIQRMSEMQNRTNSFNQALSSGNLDEAVRLQTDMVSAQEGYRVEDEQKRIEDNQRLAEQAAERLNDALEHQKELLEDQKQTALDALATIEQTEKDSLQRRQDAEKDSLQARQDAEKEALDAARQIDQQRLDSAKKAAQEQAAAKIDGTRRESEAAKRALDEELAALKTFIPKDQAELNAHISTIQGAYAAHGYQVNITGGQWGGILNAAITNGVKGSLQQLANAGEWNSTGRAIAENLIKGAFPGMDLKGLVEFIMTGKLPDATVDATGSYALKLAQQRAAIKYKNMDSAGYYHTGTTGVGGGGGYGGMYGSPKEFQATLLRGEGVLNLNAMSKPGMTDFVKNANEGKGGIGGPDLGTAAFLTASIVGGLIKSALSRGIKNAAQFAMIKKMREDAAAAAAATAAPGPAGSGVLGSADNAGIGRVSVQGKWLDATTAGIFNKVAAQIGGLYLNQGSWSTSVSASKGTHAGSGVMDVTPVSAGWDTAVNALRAAGAIAWHRTPAQGFVHHIHSVTPGIPGLSPQAANQVADFYRGGDGLGGPEGSSVPKFAKTLARELSGIGGERADHAWMRPVDGAVNSGYGNRVSPFTGKNGFHDSVDIGARNGAAIRAARGGVVAAVTNNNPDWAGRYTLLNHGDGTQTGYAHQSAQNVRRGQFVPGGAIIGRVGDTGNTTGPHLHFQYMRDGKALNPGMVIPGLSTGAEIVRSGLAMVHEKEIVLPRPLSDQFLQNAGNMGGNTYQLDISFTEPVSSEIDVQRAVENAIHRIEKRKGSKR